MFFSLVGIHILVMSWYVLNGDLYFYTDIARDFLILDEIRQKYIVFIGPRAGAPGLFHGPLWAYLNYPAYWIGGGDPIIVGWYWVGLMVLSLVIGFYIAKRIFSPKTAYSYILLQSSFLMSRNSANSHPLGAFIVVQIFFYCVVRYIQSSMLKHLITAVLLSGAIIQLEMAPGIPLFMLFFGLTLYSAYKQRKLGHLWAFLVVLVPLANYLVFDVRHDFIQLRSMFNYAQPLQDGATYNYLALLPNRFDFLITVGMQFIFGNFNLNRFISLFMLAILAVLFIQKKANPVYKLFVYFYFGFYFLSFVNKGVLLDHHVWPLVPLVYLIFASFVETKFKNIYLLIFTSIIVINLYFGFDLVKKSYSFIGRHEDSWVFLYQAAQKIIGGEDQILGYFVYSPDAFAYEPKYALSYVSRLYPEKSIYYFKKMPVTYILAAPPPPDKPGMSDEWWTKNQVKIRIPPVYQEVFPNGYKIEKYVLSEADLKIPFDPVIDTGIHFR